MNVGDRTIVGTFTCRIWAAIEAFHNGLPPVIAHSNRMKHTLTGVGPLAPLRGPSSGGCRITRVVTPVAFASPLAHASLPISDYLH